MSKTIFDRIVGLTIGKTYRVREGEKVAPVFGWNFIHEGEVFLVLHGPVKSMRAFAHPANGMYLIMNRGEAIWVQTSGNSFSPTIVDRLG